MIIYLRDILQVFINPAGLDIVFQLDLQDIDNLLFDVRIQDRERRFNAAVQVSPHPVGRCQV